MPRKNKREVTAYREGVGPTPERQRHGDFAAIEAPRIPGHDHGNVRVMRAMPVTDIWRSRGWIDEEQAKALDAFAELDGLCAWNAPARDYAALRMGSGQGCRPEWLGDAREKWRGIYGYLVDEFEERPVKCLLAWMSEPGAPDYAQAFPHGVNKAKGLARLFIVAVADELRGLLK